MKILILESVTGIPGNAKPNLFPEGFGMLSTILREFSKTNHEIQTILNTQTEKFSDWLPSNVSFEKGLDPAIRLSPDVAVVIAPEAEQAKITDKLEKEGIRVIGTDKKNIILSGDKFKSLEEVYQEVPTPETWKGNPPSSKEPLIVKPRVGTGCKNIRKIKSERPRGRDLIFQEIIKGKHASCCLLAGKEEETTVLSLNEQIISIENKKLGYRGNKIPLESPLRKKCVRIVQKAANQLGLSGYCGIDMVIRDKPYFMEANPRITTSFVGLSPLIEENLGEMLISSMVEGKKTGSPDIRGMSRLAIPLLHRSTEIEREKVARLKGISGVLAPPLARSQHPSEYYPLTLLLETGETQEEIEEKLRKKVKKVSNVLGVDESEIAWS